MAKNLSEGSAVRYRGDLPEGWGPDGIVVAVAPDVDDQIATVQFDGGGLQDIPASELDRDPAGAQHYDADGDPF